MNDLNDNGLNIIKALANLDGDLPKGLNSLREEAQSIVNKVEKVEKEEENPEEDTITDARILKDFYLMDMDDFLFVHPEINKKQYENTLKALGLSLYTVTICVNYARKVVIPASNEAEAEDRVESGIQADSIDISDDTSLGYQGHEVDQAVPYTV